MAYRRPARLANMRIYHMPIYRNNEQVQAGPKKPIYRKDENAIKKSDCLTKKSIRCAADSEELMKKSTDRAVQQMIMTAIITNAIVASRH